MKEDKKPYIARNDHGVEFLVYADGLSIILSDANKGVAHEFTPRFEARYKNITREYLANTYGKVESKEHAEFIKLLAEVNGMPCGVVSIDMNYKVFYVIDGCLFFCVEEIDAVGDYKQIKIPMPPKEVEVVNEWPVVGDTVVINTDKEHPLTFDQVGFASVNLEVIAKTERKGGVILTLENNALGVIALLHGDWIKKPKTPEEELRDELSKKLSSLTNNSLSHEGSWIKSIADAIMNNELNGFDITKKPQE